MNLISHPSEGFLPEKLLINHLYNLGHKSKNEVDKHSLNLSFIKKKDLKRLSFLIGIFHDIGKATIWFQNYIRGRSRSSPFTRHSLVSAAVCYYAVRQELNNDLYAYIAFQVVLRHHGNLSSFDMTLSIENLNFELARMQLQNINANGYESLEQFYKTNNISLEFLKTINFSELEKIVESSDEIVLDIVENTSQSLEIFFTVNYLFSLLIDFDKLDAARIEDDYFKGNLTEPINDVFIFLEYLKKQHPEKFNPEKPINKIRNEFLKDIVSNKKISPENHFYSITAPTGIGKTFGCLAFANALKKQLNKNSGRIIYCLPYTSIIDQNYLEFEKIVHFSKKEKYDNRPNRYLLKHHYLEPKEIINHTDNDNETRTLKNYLDDQLLVESWQSAIIVTTFVQLFHTLIGYKNRLLKKFHNIVNSIIILDEVQNINPDYYKLIQKTFRILGEKFGIYFLLITATQPEILKKDNIIQLTDPDKYMTDVIFNRVKLVLDEKKCAVEEFAVKFCDSFDDRNCLLVMNTKRMAKELYRVIYENFKKYAVYCLTTSLTPYDRKIQINEISEHLKKNKKVIVISTQLIEAGVDLSFKNVYRDYGPLDSIVQVAGRCNRNNEYGQTGGKMYLINLDNFRIYKQILAQYVNDVLINREYDSKDFYKISKDYFAKFDFKAESNRLLKAINELNYDKEIEDQIPVSKFSLLNDKIQNSIYILRTKQAQADMETLISLKRRFKEDLSKEDKGIIRLEIEKLKNKLAEFQISVYDSELENYRNLIEPDEELQQKKTFPYKYLSFSNQQKYAYDNKVGFLKKPKNKINSTLLV